MRRVFIVLVYKKRVLCRCSNGPTAQSMGMARLMPGKYKNTAYVVISELEDYGTMPADPTTSNCDLRNVHEYSSAMSLMFVGNVTCCLPAKLIYYIYYD